MTPRMVKMWRQCPHGVMVSEHPISESEYEKWQKCLSQGWVMLELDEHGWAKVTAGEGINTEITSKKTPGLDRHDRGQPMKRG